VSVTRLTDEQEAALLEVAANAVRQTLEHGSHADPDETTFDAALRRPATTFVTLERDGQLLGCIGSLEPKRELVTDVAHNAVAAAFRDPGLPPVTADDYRLMWIEISVL
jgi:AMMECR1 domain-containing protein